MDYPRQATKPTHITPVQHTPIEHVPTITPAQRAPTRHVPIIEPPIRSTIAKTRITPIEHIPIEHAPTPIERIPIEHITPVQHTPIQRLTSLASTVASATLPIQVMRVREPVRAPITGIQAPTSFINALENISRERLGKPLPIERGPIEGGTPIAIAYLPRGGLPHNQGIIITPRRSILPSNALSELRKEVEEKNTAIQHGIALAPIKSRLPSPSAPPLNPHEIIPGLPQVAQLVNNGGELGLRLFLQDLQRQGVPLNYSNIVNYFVKQGVNLGEARNLANKVEQRLLEEHLSKVQASLPKLPPTPTPTSSAGASSSPSSLTGFLDRLIHVTVTPLSNQYLNTNAKLYTANINIDQVMKEVDQFLKQHPVLAANAFPFAGFINNQLMINENELRKWLMNYYQAYLTELNLPGAEEVTSYIASHYGNNPGMMQQLIGGLTNAYAGALTLTGGSSPYALPLLFVPQLNNLYEETVQAQIAQKLNKELSQYQPVLNNVVNKTTSAMSSIPKRPPWPTIEYGSADLSAIDVLKGGGSNNNPVINQAIKTAKGALSEIPNLTKLSQEVQKTINQALSAGMAIPSQLTPLSPNQLQAITSTLQDIVKAGTAYEELFGAPNHSPLFGGQPGGTASYSYEYVGGLLGKYLTTPPGVSLNQSLNYSLTPVGLVGTGLNLSLKIPPSVLLSAYSVNPALINAWSGISPIPKTHPYITNPYAPAQLYLNPNSPLGQWINQENSLAGEINSAMQQYATAIAQLTGQSQSIPNLPTITLPTTIPIITKVTTKTITNTTNPSPNADLFNPGNILGNELNALLGPNIAAFQQLANTPPPSTGASMFPSRIPITITPQDQYVAGLIASGSRLAPGMQSLYSSNPFLRGLAGAWWDIYNYIAPITQIAAQYVLPPYWRGYLTQETGNTNAAFLAAQPTLARIPTNRWGLTAASLLGMPTQGNEVIINPAGLINPAIIIAGIAGSGLESLSKVGRLADIAPTLEAISNIRYIDPMTYVFEGGAAAAGGVSRAVSPIFSTLSRNIGLGVGGLGARLMSGAVTDLLNRMGYRVEAAAGEEEAQALLTSGAYRGANNLFLVPVKPITPALGRINIPMDLPTLTALYGEFSDAYYRDLYRGLEMYFNTPPGELMSRGLAINAPLWDSLRLRLGSMLEGLGRRIVLPPSLFRSGAPLIQGVQVEEAVPGEGIYFAQPITEGRMRVPIVPQGFFYYSPRGVVGAITNRGVIPLGLSIGGSAAPGITNRFIGISDVLEASPFNFRLTTQPYTTSQELGNLIMSYWRELGKAYAAARSAAVRDALTDMELSPLARLLAAASEYVLPKSLRPLLPETLEDWNKGLLAAAAARILEETGGEVTLGPSPIEGMIYRVMGREAPPRATFLLPQDFLQQAIQGGLPRAAVSEAGIYLGRPVTMSYASLSNTINEMMREMRGLPSVATLTNLPDTLISSIGLSGYGPLLIPRSGGSILDYGIISDLLGGRALGYSVMGSPIIIRGGEAWPGGIPIRGATVLTGEYGDWGIGEGGNAPTTPIEGAPSEGGRPAMGGGSNAIGGLNTVEGSMEELLMRGEEGGVPLLARAPIQASEAAEEAEAALSVPRPTMNNAPTTAQTIPAQKMSNAPTPAPTTQSSIDTITQLEPNMNEINDIIKRYSINNIDKDIMTRLRDLETLRMTWRTSLGSMQAPSTREWTWSVPRYPIITETRNNEEEESTTTTSVQSSIQLPTTTSTTTIQYQPTGSREEMYLPPPFLLENPNQSKPEPPWWWGLNQEAKRREREKERKAGKAREKLML